MSFVHYVRVGYFGAPEESHPARELKADECVELMRHYNALAPVELKVHCESPLHPAIRGSQVLGMADDRLITLKSGLLLCPYLDTEYVYPAIGFAGYVQKVLGCSIYSDDEGRTLSLDEFIPTKSFSQLMSEAVDRHGVPLDDVLQRASRSRN